MSFDNLLHIAEIIVLGIPLWWGFFKMLVIFREYPPHRHDNGNVLYPTGYEPGKISRLDGRW